MVNFDSKVAELLGAAVPVLIYAGEVDFICNWIGNKAWTLGLNWTGAEAFGAAPDSAWSVGGAAAGLRRTAQGLSFLQVFDAGHSA